MGSEIYLKGLLLGCVVLHAHGFFENASSDELSPEVCARLYNKLQSCLKDMSSRERSYYKEKLATQGAQDQMAGCVRRTVRSEHIKWLCDDSRSVDLLVGCIDMSLKEHTDILFRSRVTRFTDEIRDCVFDKLKPWRAYVEMMTTVLAGQGHTADIGPFFADEEVPLMMTTSGRALS